MVRSRKNNVRHTYKKRRAGESNRISKSIKIEMYHKLNAFQIATNADIGVEEVLFSGRNNSVGRKHVSLGKLFDISTYMFSIMLKMTPKWLKIKFSRS